MNRTIPLLIWCRCEKGWVSSRESAEEVWRPLFRKYNQSRRGLKSAGYEFDDSEYWSYHRSGVEHFMSVDIELRALLQSLPQKKYIFTNCDEQEAVKALTALGDDR